LICASNEAEYDSGADCRREQHGISLGAASGVVTARSDRLEWALVQAYQHNPSLNAQGAATSRVAGKSHSRADGAQLVEIV